MEHPKFSWKQIPFQGFSKSIWVTQLLSSRLLRYKKVFVSFDYIICSASYWRCCRGILEMKYVVANFWMISYRFDMLVTDFIHYNNDSVTNIFNVSTSWTLQHHSSHKKDDISGYRQYTKTNCSIHRGRQIRHLCSILIFYFIQGCLKGFVNQKSSTIW